MRFKLALAVFLKLILIPLVLKAETQPEIFLDQYQTYYQSKPRRRSISFTREDGLMRIYSSPELTSAELKTYKEMAEIFYETDLQISCKKKLALIDKYQIELVGEDHSCPVCLLASDANVLSASKDKFILMLENIAAGPYNAATDNRVRETLSRIPKLPIKNVYGEEHRPILELSYQISDWKNMRSVLQNINPDSNLLELVQKANLEDQVFLFILQIVNKVSTSPVEFQKFITNKSGEEQKRILETLRTIELLNRSVLLDYKSLRLLLTQEILPQVSSLDFLLFIDVTNAWFINKYVPITLQGFNFPVPNYFTQVHDAAQLINDFRPLNKILTVAARDRAFAENIMNKACDDLTSVKPIQKIVAIMGSEHLAGVEYLFKKVFSQNQLNSADLRTNNQVEKCDQMQETEYEKSRSVLLQSNIETSRKLLDQ